MEALSCMFNKTIESHLFKGCKLPNNGPSISHLLFTDDALIVGEGNLSNVRCMARLLRCFHLASGLKINISKSKLTGGRLTLLKAVMETIPTYYFCIYKASVKILDILEAKRWRFLWNATDLDRGICWVSWDHVTSPIEAGGLGLTPLREVNEVVVEILNGTACTWNSIARLENGLASMGISISSLIKGVVGNGMQIRFWLDCWTAQQPLTNMFPTLYSIERDKGKLIGNSILMWNDQYQWFWSWKRKPSTTLELMELAELTNLIANPIISQQEDSWLWMDDKTNTFTVASMKKFLCNSRIPNQNFIMEWNSWIPKKVNIFMWQAEQERIQTRRNLAIRQIPIDSLDCPLCGIIHESATHLFSIQDILSIHNSIPIASEKKKKAIQGHVGFTLLFIFLHRSVFNYSALFSSAIVVGFSGGVLHVVVSDSAAFSSFVDGTRISMLLVRGFVFHGSNWSSCDALCLQGIGL
ncbi:hypothetical protein QVD17_17055 [Tagetes erecta]|uniref:Reverse transcriptase zinc-binding domain-containing protein n=1 Tax=Tagetes erecta TaxID=13708 RepID=A0AAD8KW39_TARER|nr:hypothetical protein QVD17_17055 [Tagetes erecta]